MLLGASYTYNSKKRYLPFIRMGTLTLTLTPALTLILTLTLTLTLILTLNLTLTLTLTLTPALPLTRLESPWFFPYRDR